jgi:hypothetical protein
MFATSSRRVRTLRIECEALESRDLQAVAFSAGRVMLNPQPLPPRFGAVMLNPQPLPPQAFAVMLNPQPLPPRK